MTIFGRYADVYDAIYEDKDYVAECRYVESLWRQYTTKPVRQVLDLGCGTGGHALPLAKAGYEVTGIDASSEMLARAEAKAREAALQIRWYQADLCGFETGQICDAAVAMFAVMGYLTRNEDLQTALMQIRKHLEPGGLFVWDAWYGPTVLTRGPEKQLKIVEGAGRRTYRFAQPRANLLLQTVDVEYSVVSVTGERKITEFQETHRMRYFFPQEIALLLGVAGFELITLLPFMQTEGVPSNKDWNVMIVSRRL